MEMNKINKISLMLLLSLLFSCGDEIPNSSTSSPTIEDNIVYGFVLDTNNNGIDDVILKLALKGKNVVEVSTDENGRYEFLNLAVGSYEIIIIPPSDSYVYDGDKVRFSYLQEPNFKMRDITLRKTNFQWGELS